MDRQTTYLIGLPIAFTLAVLATLVLTAPDNSAHTWDVLPGIAGMILLTCLFAGVLGLLAGLFYFLGALMKRPSAHR